MMSIWRCLNSRLLKIVIKALLERYWLSIDYTGAGAEVFAIRNTRLVFGLPTTTHAHGGERHSQLRCQWLHKLRRRVKLNIYLIIIKFLLLLNTTARALGRGSVAPLNLAKSTGVIVVIQDTVVSLSSVSNGQNRR